MAEEEHVALEAEGAELEALAAAEAVPEARQAWGVGEVPPAPA